MSITFNCFLLKCMKGKAAHHQEVSLASICFFPKGEFKSLTEVKNFYFLSSLRLCRTQTKL